jgi:hypothetical protein
MNISETPEQRNVRWASGIERVYGEVSELHSNREIWQFFNEELPKHGGQIIHETITRWYVDSQAAAVRRLASDKSQDKQSLYRILRSIDSNVGDFNGEKYKVVMTSQTVQEDMATLKQTAHVVSRWADENVAHLGRKSTTNPTFNDLDSAIDTLGKLFTKYNLVLTGGYMPDVKPVIQDNWKRPFTKPLFN